METTKKAEDGLYFPALTGIRAIAAYMVFFHHFVPETQSLAGIKTGYFLGELHIGVTFFFVLSGFLIHNRYSATPVWNKESYIKYFLARVARIMPLYLILTVFTFGVLISSNEIPVSKNLIYFFLNASLLKGFFSGLKFSGIPQSWSLTVEFCFYALAPLLFWRLRNVHYYPWVSIGFLLIGFLLVYLFTMFPFYGLFGDNRFMLSYTFFGRSFEFFAGCYLSSKFKEWPSNTHSGGYATYGGLLAVCLAVYILGDLRQPQVPGVFTIPGLIINNFFLPLAIILFFKGLLFENTVIRKWLSSSLFQLLGKASYAFYLIHVGIISRAISHYTGHEILLIFLLINLVSIVLYSYVEEPLNLAFRRVFIRRRSLPA